MKCTVNPEAHPQLPLLRLKVNIRGAGFYCLFDNEGESLGYRRIGNIIQSLFIGFFSGWGYMRNLLFYLVLGLVVEIDGL